jgi:hypothetical protein
MRALKTICALAVLLGPGNAYAATSLRGTGALALAALVGLHSPNVSARDRSALSSMLNGDRDFVASSKINVVAQSVLCNSTNVDLTRHSCEIKFGSDTRELSGREAHELYATLIENGVANDPGAGSNHFTVSNLDCPITIKHIKNYEGGGADCTVDAEMVQP